jgi:hypothetical protein
VWSSEDKYFDGCFALEVLGSLPLLLLLVGAPAWCGW